MTRTLSGFAIALALLTATVPAVAGAYPEKPIRIIVTTAAGGASDIVCRLLAQRLGPLLHQSIIVEDRDGANGNIGAQYVATSPPDGYTLMLGQIGPLAINASLYKHMAYDPIRDFAPIARLVAFSNLLVVKADLPVHSVAELIAYAKARPGELSFGSPGVGGSPYMAMVLFNQMAQLQMVHVPYRGAAPALAALMGGFIDTAFSDPLVTLPMLPGGRVRALAVSGAHRLPSAPDLPTVGEAGLPGYAVSSWLGIVGPVGMAADQVQLLNTTFNDILRLTDVQAALGAQGAEPFAGTPQAFGAFMKDEAARWKKVVDDGNLSIGG